MGRRYHPLLPVGSSNRRSIGSVVGRKVVSLQQISKNSTIMGKQVEKTFRGRCKGKTLRKDGKPKHAGNFSYSTLHAQSRQSKSWFVWRTEEGHLMVGDHTPLLCLLSPAAVQFAMDDHTFTGIEFRTHRVMFGKQYETSQRLTRSYERGRWDDRKFEYVYTEEIWTDNDFNYKFENY